MNAASADSGIDRNTADGRAQAAEEDQDHEAGQDQTDAALVEQRLDRALDEQRLVEHDVGLQLLRHVDQLADQVLDAVDDRDRVGVAALLHDRAGRPSAGRRRWTMLFWIWLRVLGVADVADAHHRVARPS